MASTDSVERRRPDAEHALADGSISAAAASAPSSSTSLSPTRYPSSKNAWQVARPMPPRLRSPGPHAPFACISRTAFSVEIRALPAARIRGPFGRSISSGVSTRHVLGRADGLEPAPERREQLRCDPWPESATWLKKAMIRMIAPYRMSWPDWATPLEMSAERDHRDQQRARDGLHVRALAAEDRRAADHDDRDHGQQVVVAHPEVRLARVADEQQSADARPRGRSACTRGRSCAAPAGPTARTPGGSSRRCRCRGRTS